MWVCTNEFLDVSYVSTTDNTDPAFGWKCVQVTPHQGGLKTSTAYAVLKAFRYLIP